MSWCVYVCVDVFECDLSVRVCVHTCMESSSSALITSVSLQPPSQWQSCLALALASPLYSAFRANSCPEGPSRPFCLAVSPLRIIYFFWPRLSHSGECGGIVIAVSLAEELLVTPPFLVCELSGLSTRCSGTWILKSSEAEMKTKQNQKNTPETACP